MLERTYPGKNSDAAKLTAEIVSAGIVYGSRFFGVTSVPSVPRTIVYVPDDLTSPEATTIDNTVAAHVAQTLADAKTARKAFLSQRGEDFGVERYSTGAQESLHSLYSSALRNRPNRVAYIQPWINWLSEIDTEVKNKQVVIDTKTTIPEVDAVVLDEATLISHDPLITVAGALAVVDATALDSFLDANAVVTDGLTGVQGAFYLMQELTNRRELYNDAQNPLYSPGFVPILGSAGWSQDHADRIDNIETIHGKLGWHNQQVERARYRQPKDLLIYYGWLNSFNSAQNQWDNEKVALDMSKYAILVFGDGLQDPSHGDYANTQVIIPRIKALNPSALIFGYVTTAQAIGTFQTKVDQWNTLGVHGIFMDEAGYDYGTNRADFNTRVDYVHGKSSANLAFPNAWNTDHILGTANDPSYPNATYNPSLVASSLTTSDWALLESFPINTSAYAGSGGYEAKAEWAARGVKMTTLRATYGVNFAAVGVINDDNAGGVALFQFGFVSAMMFSLEAFGTSDTSYGSGSAKAKFWTRPNAAGMGDVWTLNPSVQNSTSDNDVYYRFTEMGRLELDFSTGAQLSYLRKTSGQ
jgi:hypothetical protein